MHGRRLVAKQPIIAAVEGTPVDHILRNRITHPKLYSSDLSGSTEEDE